MSNLRERNNVGKEVAGWTDPSDLNVYSFRYSGEYPVRIDDGAGDTKFSHMERRESWYHVAARPSPKRHTTCIIRRASISATTGRRRSSSSTRWSRSANAGSQIHEYRKKII